MTNNINRLNQIAQSEALHSYQNATLKRLQTDYHMSARKRDDASADAKLIEIIRYIEKENISSIRYNRLFETDAVLSPRVHAGLQARKWEHSYVNDKKKVNQLLIHLSESLINKLVRPGIVNTLIINRNMVLEKLRKQAFTQQAQQSSKKLKPQKPTKPPPKPLNRRTSKLSPENLHKYKGFIKPIA